MNKVDIRGIDLLAAKNQDELVDFLFHQGEVKTGQLIAINAEKVVLSDEQPKIKALLQQAEHKYADGISVVYSVRKKYPQYQTIERIAGADLWQALMKRAGELNIPVFLIGGTVDTLAKVIEKLALWQVKIVGSQDGYFSAKQEEYLIRQIAQSGAKVVTVALGSPKQELFIQKARQYYPQALYMGVGGSYDVFVGKVKRAPAGWQKLGMEWLYRLLQQPTRWKRQKRLLKYFYYYLTNQL